MASTRQLRNRIRSVRNTAKITKAMELVAASKMRRAQERLLASRPYSEKMVEFLADLVPRLPAGEESGHALLEVRPVRAVGVIHITSDRGLAGGLNSNVNRSLTKLLSDESVPANIIAVGKKGRDFLLRTRQNVVAEFTGLPDYPEPSDTRPIATVARDAFEAGEVDKVLISYTRYYSTASQKPEAFQLLPVIPPSEEAGAVTSDYIVEPDVVSVLDALLPRYIEVVVYQAILEAIGSEHSARTVAMRNASDNAKEMIDDLTLAYNKARQESITAELLDLVGGVSAVAG